MESTLSLARLTIENAILTKGEFDRPTLRMSGAVYDCHGNLIPASLRPHNGEHWTSMDPLQIRVVPEVEHNEAVYLGHFFRHFGHFLIETLPTLYWARHFPTNEIPLLFHAFYGHGRWVLWHTPHIEYCLNALGVPGGRIFFVDKCTRVRALHVMPRPYIINEGPAFDFSEVYRTIRDAALRDGCGPVYERVYFSRRQWPQDVRCSNEAEIEAQFSARGFHVVSPERLAFSDQVRLAASAKIVAGLDGSAMHLAAFMNGGKAIVLEARASVRNIYAISKMVGVETLAAPAGDADAIRRTLAMLDEDCAPSLS